MKYAFNTWCYGSFPTWLPSYPLDEVVRRLAAIGYDGIEIGCAARTLGPPICPLPDARSCVASWMASA